MITRVFRGRLQVGMREDFVRHLSDVGIPEFLRSPGVVGLEVHLPEDDGGEIFCATSWRDVEHVKAFAGEEWAKPRMQGDEASMLLAASVGHYMGSRASGALLSPVGQFPSGDMTCGRIQIEERKGRVQVDGETFVLPPRELRLFKALLSAWGDPVAPRDLALEVWPHGACMTADDVRRAIHKLRRALGDHRRHPPLVRNRRGFGYLIDL